jgi:cytochrome P450 family 135
VAEDGRIESRLPPGPKYPGLLATLKWQRQLVPLLETSRARYGDIWTLRLMGGEKLVFVSEPELLKSVFEADATVLHGGASVATALLGPQSLIIVSEGEHAGLRTLMQPLFHREQVQGYRGIMARICEEELTSWPLGKPMPLLPGMQTITLRVIMSVVFGVTGGERQEMLRTRIHELLEWATPWHMALHQARFMRGWSPAKSFLRFRASLDDMVFEEIDRTRHDPRLEEREDILAMLVQARYEDGTALTEAELRDQLMTLLIQGHHSTSNALAWALERLMRHPDVFERVRAEAETESEDYVGAVVNETLRLFPPLPVPMRRVNSPFRLGEYQLEPGTVIAVNLYVLHRRPDLWPDPNRFRPERFLEQPPAKYTWLPFGEGERSCIASRFAITEMREVLRKLARQARLAPAEQRDEDVVKLGLLLSPSRGAQAVLLERVPAAEAAGAAA